MHLLALNRRVTTLPCVGRGRADSYYPRAWLTKLEPSQELTAFNGELRPYGQETTPLARTYGVFFMPAPQDPRLGTTAEAARILKTHPVYLARLAKKGTAPVTPVRLGRVWRWPLAQLEALARGEGKNA